jgi:hypothetical protein
MVLRDIEQLEHAMAILKAMMAAQAGKAAKVIEGETAEVVPSLPAPDVFADRPAKVAADNGAKECKPRKRGPSPV